MAGKVRCGIFLQVIGPDKKAALQARMTALQICEEDLVEKFILGSGPGGQKINKTSSCVYLKHLPSGIEVKCQAGRSREANRHLARVELCEALEGIRREKNEAKKQEIELYRRRNRQRSRNSKLRSVADKRKRSQKKNLRRSPGRDD